MIKIDFKNVLFNYCQHFPIETDEITLDNTNVKVNGESLPLIRLLNINTNTTSNEKSEVTFTYIATKLSDFEYEMDKSLVISGEKVPYIDDPDVDVNIKDYGENGSKAIEVTYKASIINSTNAVDF